MNALRIMRHSQFLRHNVIFFLGSVAVGVLNYLYYPVIGRLLAPAAFGEVQALVSLFLQIGIFLTVFGLITVNVVANYHDESKRNAIVLEFEKLALIIGLALLIVVIAFQDWLKSFLQFDTSLPFVLLAIAVVATVPFTFRSAFLRGREKFSTASAANVLGSASKLLLSAVLVAIGFGTAGAIGGIVLAQAVAWSYAAWKAAKLGLVALPSPSKSKLPNIRLLLPELRYGLLVLVASLFITIQYSIDIVVAKHYFDAETAGLYAGVASVARIIFFLTASIAQVLMPAVKLTNTTRANRIILLKSILLLGMVGLPALALFTFAPNNIVGLLMGNAYEHMAHVLPLLSLAIFIVSILNLLVAYYLSLRRWGIAAVTLIGGTITYGLMIHNHGSVEDVVSNLLAGSISMIIALIAWRMGALIKENVWQRSS